LSVKPTILKLGGSVITRKEKPLTPNTPMIRRLAKEISEANVSPLVIIHGGGSFGHPIAKEHGIKGGYKDPSQIIGFSKTHLAMLTLNRLVVASLINHNIPAVGVQPSSIVISKSGRIHFMEDKPLKKLLDMGFVPVLHGDTVLDSEIGFTILSGDQLAAFLAIELGAGRIIMGIDVNGLYTADPKVDPSATLISHITLRELKRLQHKIRGAKVTDVTGGMLGKVVELMPAVERGIPAIIISAIKPDNLYRALRREKLVGTTIEKGESFG